MKAIVERIKEIRRRIPEWTLENEIEFLKGEVAAGRFNMDNLDYLDLPEVFEAHDVVNAYGAEDLLAEIPVDVVCDFYGDDLTDEIEDEVLDRLKANGMVVVPDDDELVSNADPYELVKDACNAVEGGCKSKDDLKRIVMDIIDSGWDGRFTR